MVSRSDAILNLTSLLNHAPGGEVEVHDEGLLAPSETQLQESDLALSGPLAWELTVRSTGGDDDFIVEGSVHGTAVMECRRCLGPAEAEVRTSFIFPAVYRPGTEGLRLLETDDEELLVFGKPSVDFEHLLVEVFAIDLPLTALCRVDCRGLTLEGVNLNEVTNEVEEALPEPQAQKPAPSPFAALEDLALEDLALEDLEL